MTENQNEKTLTEHEGHGTLLARFLWAIIGPVALLTLAWSIVKSGQLVTLWDLLYWANTGLMILGRRWEQRTGKGTTLYGEPMTQANFKSYVVKLVAFSLLVWIVCKVAGRIS
jgi:hypothetical protein